MKRNPYSRNNIIKTYHEISGLSYKTCRENLKANNWDLLKAYGAGLTTAIEGLSEAIGVILNKIVSEARECFEKFDKALNESLDRVKMANAKDVTEANPGYDLGGVDMSFQSDMTVYVYKEV